MGTEDYKDLFWQEMRLRPKKLFLWRPCSPAPPSPLSPERSLKRFWNLHIPGSLDKSLCFLYWETLPRPSWMIILSSPGKWQVDFGCRSTDKAQVLLGAQG